jgi:uncharacterized protein (DUF302 family)
MLLTNSGLLHWHGIITPSLKNSVPSFKAFVVLESNFTVKESIDRLVILLQRYDMIVYARINRQTEAKWYGRATRPLEFILFDDPNLTAPLVEENPLISLCFPMRIIAWEDEIGRNRIAYKDPLVTIKEFRLNTGTFDWPDLRPLIAGVLTK